MSPWAGCHPSLSLSPQLSLGLTSPALCEMRQGLSELRGTEMRSYVKPDQEELGQLPPPPVYPPCFSVGRGTSADAQPGATSAVSDIYLV